MLSRKNIYERTREKQRNAIIQFENETDMECFGSEI